MSDDWNFGRDIAPKRTTVAPKEGVPRSRWQRFKDEYLNAALHSPLGAEGLVRLSMKLQGHTDDEINAAERRLSDQLAAKNAADPNFRKDRSFVGDLTHGATTLAANLLGGADPTYVISPGRSVVQRVLAQAAINGGVDAASQGIEINRGVRDEFDPTEVAINAAAGGVFQGTGEAVGKYRTGRSVARGSRHQTYNDLLPTVLGLEGGGTLRNPKVSPKGAKGPMQVMDATARAPGFGIRPWNGKTEADRARVGRQYLAVMVDRYDGDHAKILAAYNWGPGAVDKAVKKYSSNWLAHAPAETKKYVRNGFKRLGKNQGEQTWNDLPPERQQETLNTLDRPAEGEINPSDQLKNDVIDFIDQNESGVGKLANPEQIENIDPPRYPHPKDENLEAMNILQFDEFLKKHESPDYPAISEMRNRLDADEVSVGQAIKEYRDNIETPTNENIVAFPNIEKTTPSTWDGAQRIASEEIAKRENLDPIQFHSEYTNAANNFKLDSNPLFKEVDYRANQLFFNKETKADNIIDINEEKGRRLDKESDNLIKERTKQYEDAYWDARTILDTTNKGTPILTRKEAEEHLNTIKNYRDRHWTTLPLKSREVLDDVVKVHEQIVAALGGKPYKGPKLTDRAPLEPLRPANENVSKKNLLKDFWEDDSGAVDIDPYELPKESITHTGNLNLNRIAAPEEVKNILRDRASATGRIGTQEWDELETQALKLLKSKDPVDLIEHEPSVDELPAYSEAIRTLNLSIGKRMVRVARDIIDPTTKTDDLLKELEELRSLGAAADARRAGVTNAVARALSAHRRIIHNPIKGYELSENLGTEAFARTVIENADNPGDIGRLARESMHDTFWNGVANVLNIPRALMSTADLSAPFRQGVFLVGRKEFWKAIPDMFKQGFSEEQFRNVQAEISSRPTYELMKKSKLALSSMDRFLTEREEAFMSDLAEKIPVAGRVVHASNRAYMGFLNKLRADTFDSLVRQYEAAGVDLRENTKALQDISKFINAATGRGSLGKFNQAVPFLNGVFFSPRLIASRLTLMNPATYVRLDPIVRKEAIKSLLSFSGIAMTVLGLAAAGGLSVSGDPRSADFAKIKTGNTRFDILGGFQQYIRLGAQLITNETVTSKGKVKELGKGYKADTRATMVGRFLRSKESPVMSFIHDYAEGKNVIGKKFELKEELKDRFIPMIIQDITDAMKEYGPEGAAVAVPAMFGVSVSTYKPTSSKPKKKKSNDEWNF